MFRNYVPSELLQYLDAPLPAPHSQYGFTVLYGYIRWAVKQRLHRDLDNAEIDKDEECCIEDINFRDTYIPIDLLISGEVPSMIPITEVRRIRDTYGPQVRLSFLNFTPDFPYSVNDEASVDRLVSLFINLAYACSLNRWGFGGIMCRILPQWSSFWYVKYAAVAAARVGDLSLIKELKSFLESESHDVSTILVASADHKFARIIKNFWPGCDFGGDAMEFLRDRDDVDIVKALIDPLRNSKHWRWEWIREHFNNDKCPKIKAYIESLD